MKSRLNKNMKLIQILLSTYNGEKYIKEQLDSIIKQDYQNITILIRDDGSTDRTVDIIKEYAKQYNNITFYQGHNIGVKKSFFDLVKNSDMTADYFMFSDQDDVWKNNKISGAVEKLELMQQDIPLLYCGRTTLVNEELVPIKSTIKKYKIIPGFGNALVENICTGCTMAVNRKLIQLVKTHIPEFTVMHDWWFYLTASCYGKVYYDDETYILYRQHTDNIVGIRSSYREEFKKRLNNYKGNRGKISDQLSEFLRLYQIDKEKQMLLMDIIKAKYKFMSRLNLLFTDKIYRQRKLDNLIFKLLFLLGKV
jgi:glycosyltransferase involved in cell wall biosynthesis